MRRFLMNRWCAFVLTLCVGFATLSFVSSTALADARMGEDPGRVEDWTTGGSTPPPPPTAGDPDIPENGLKGNLIKGGAVRASSTLHAAGDGTSWNGVWSWRVQVVLQLLRQGWIVRF